VAESKEEEPAIFLPEPIPGESIDIFLVKSFLDNQKSETTKLLFIPGLLLLIYICMNIGWTLLLR